MSHPNRGIALVCALFLLGCGEGGEEAAAGADTLAMPPVEAPAAPATSMAGSWNMSVFSGDSVLAQYVLTATDSQTGWVLNFPNRDPVEARVVAMGADTAVTEAGPYPSVLREGQTVRTHTVFRLDGDTLRASTTATYEGAGADSVAMLSGKGTRAP